MESIFFDSQVTYDEYGTPVYDRPNSAAQLRATFASLLANGIVSTRTSPMAPEIGFIVNPSEGMTISVNKGTCWINGSCGMEDSRRNFTLDAGTSQPRIDIIVLRWDNRQAARNIDVFVKKGSPSGDPITPALQRDSSVYELCVAKILVPANATKITAGNITDTRLDTDVCGIVVGLVENIDTSELYNQIQGDLNDFRGVEQQEFLAWFENLKDVLSGDVAGNLQLQIDECAKESDVFLLSHPIGSLFETTVSTNPGTLYGGTWAAWGGGRTPVGVNTADTSFNTVEKTGGEKAHVLTEAEVAPHRHKQINYWSGNAGSNIVVTQGLETSDPRQYGGYDVFTDNAGGGQAHNNLPPYITCYIWKRTA